MLDLTGIRERLQTQNGRMTANPIFVVQEEEKIYGMAEGYSDAGEWMDREGATYATRQDFEMAGKAYREMYGEEESIERFDSKISYVRYIRRWKFVQPFLTEAAANAYIKQNSHHLTNPRVYVESGYRNYEWEGIRKYFMAESAEEAA
jgi:hypothetical protein